MTETNLLPERLTIAQVADRSGLSKDTLRWYEREGMLPEVPRGLDGHRGYSPRVASLVILLARLRATGMPTADDLSVPLHVGAPDRGRCVRQHPDLGSRYSVHAHGQRLH